MNITITVDTDELVQAIVKVQTLLQLAQKMETSQPITPQEKPKAPRVKAEKEAPAPKVVTLEEVRARLGELSSNGKKEEIKSLFAQFGVAKLTELEPAKFGELLAAAEAL